VVLVQEWYSAEAAVAEVAAAEMLLMAENSFLEPPMLVEWDH